MASRPEEEFVDLGYVFNYNVSKGDFEYNSDNVTKNDDDLYALAFADSVHDFVAHPDRLSEMMSEVLFEMFLLSSPNYK